MPKTTAYDVLPQTHKCFNQIKEAIMERFSNKPLLITCLVFLIITTLETSIIGWAIVYHKNTPINSLFLQSSLETSGSIERHRCTFVEDVKHLDTGKEQLLCHLEEDLNTVPSSDLPALGEPSPGIKLNKAKGLQ